MTLPLTPLGLMGRTAPPSFPILRSVNDNDPGTFGSSHDIALPPGIQAGDLVIVAYFAIATGAITDLPVPSGWSDLGGVDLSPGGVLTHVVKIISIEAPAPMSTVTVTSSGFSTSVCSNSYCFSLWSDLTLTGFIEGTDANPNPPQLTPSGWGANPRVTWISMMATRSSVVSVTDTSLGFSGTLDSDSGSSPYARLLSSRRDLRIASLDPGAWSLSGSAPWAAATLAVRGT